MQYTISNKTINSLNVIFRKKKEKEAIIAKFIMRQRNELILLKICCYSVFSQYDTANRVQLFSYLTLPSHSTNVL